MTEIDELLREGQRAWNLGNPKDAMNFYDRVLHYSQKILKHSQKGPCVRKDWQIRAGNFTL